MAMNGWTQIGWHSTDRCRICGGAAMIVSHPDGRICTSAVCDGVECSDALMANVSDGARRYIAALLRHAVN